MFFAIFMITILNTCSNNFKEANMEELLELALKKIDVLEKKLEKYYSLLKIDNELDFILNGSYIIQEDLDNVLVGQY